ncbi:MAG: Rid family hydrolase [Acidobacteriota bacterium]
MKYKEIIRVALMPVLLVGFIGVAAFTDKPNETKRRYINLPGRTSQAPFSDAVMVGDTLYLSGRLGTDPKTGMPPADVEQEIRLMLDGIKSTLAAADMTMDDLVQVQVFCSDLSLYDKFNTIYRSYFKQNPPARAFIGSGTLLRGARFELMGIAAKESKTVK